MWVLVALVEVLGCEQIRLLRLLGWKLGLGCGFSMLAFVVGLSQLVVDE